MRAIIQRVTSASVIVDGAVVGEIGTGLLILLGVTHSDSAVDAAYLAKKIVNLRIFSDDQGKMNRSLLDISGGLLAVSQFTLYGDSRRGRRPGFDAAAPPEQARSLYERFVESVKQAAPAIRVATGIFQAHMEVALVNDGPVTLIIDSPNKS